MKQFIQDLEKRLKVYEEVPKIDAGKVYTFVGGDTLIKMKELKELIILAKRRLKDVEQQSKKAN